MVGDTDNTSHIPVNFLNRELSPEEELVEAVITRHCYAGEEYRPPHLPEIFKRNLETLEKKKTEKGELYKKMKSMYEMSLPISLAFYASDKRSREWNKEYFSTKVDQKAYFECLCGGTEEARGECYQELTRNDWICLQTGPGTGSSAPSAERSSTRSVSSTTSPTRTGASTAVLTAGYRGTRSSPGQLSSSVRLVSASSG